MDKIAKKWTEKNEARSSSSRLQTADLPFQGYSRTRYRRGGLCEGSLDTLERACVKHHFYQGFTPVVHGQSTTCPLSNQQPVSWPWIGVEPFPPPPLWLSLSRMCVRKGSSIWCSVQQTRQFETFLHRVLCSRWSISYLYPKQSQNDVYPVIFHSPWE